MITKISQLMSTDVETVQSVSTLQAAAEKMRDRNVGALPVYVGTVLSGIVTDRDITVRATAMGLDPQIDTVESAMSWKVEWCHEDMTVASAARIMLAKGLRRLVVLDGQGSLAGIVSLSDIATKTHDERLVEKVVEASASRIPSIRMGDRWTSFEGGRIGGMEP